LAQFELGGKSYIATLDRGITVATSLKDDFPEHDAHIVSSFRAAFSNSGGLTVIREYGFPTLMHDVEGLALSLGALAVHLGYEERVSRALEKFAPNLLSDRALQKQFWGGAYVMVDGVFEPVKLDDSLRIVAVRRSGAIRFEPTPRPSLVSKVMELVAQLPASEVKVYSTNTLGTTVYDTGTPSRLGV